MRDVLVLCYHAVSPAWPAALSVTPERLESQLAGLVRRGYRGVTFAQALSAPPGARVLAVTFDDAFRSVLTRAAPILERLGLPATVFAPTDPVERGGPLRWPGIERWGSGPHAAELAPLSWQELRRLAGAGWEVGSHTRTHPHLTRLADAELAAELRGSRETIAERLGRPCVSIAYPYGDVDDRVAAAAGAAGYAFGAGLSSGRLRAGGPLRRPRIGIYHADGSRRFAAKVSPGARAARATPAWDVAERVRAGLVAAGRGRAARVAAP